MRQEYSVLIVDDSTEDREFYRRYLSRDKESSYSILEAKLGQQGLVYMATIPTGYCLVRLRVA